MNVPLWALVLAPAVLFIFGVISAVQTYLDRKRNQFIDYREGVQRRAQHSLPLLGFDVWIIAFKTVFRPPKSEFALFRHCWGRLCGKRLFVALVLLVDLADGKGTAGTPAVISDARLHWANHVSATAMFNDVSKAYGDGFLIAEATEVHSTHLLAYEKRTGVVVWVEEVYPSKEPLVTNSLQLAIFIWALMALVEAPIANWLVVVLYLGSALLLWLVGVMVRWWRTLNKRESEAEANDDAAVAD